MRLDARQGAIGENSQLRWTDQCFGLLWLIASKPLEKSSLWDFLSVCFGLLCLDASKQSELIGVSASCGTWDSGKREREQEGGKLDE